ncbi:MAG: helix-turn-helix domain-containing protein [Eubacterium sp.]|nr:helix-turn-helix domain-containing protein [Eubacterium sp.]
MDTQKVLLRMTKSINSLSSIPTRLYEGSIKIAGFSVVPFKPDPVTPHLETILNQKNCVNIYATENLIFYGSVIKDNYTLIIGPVGRIRLNDVILTEMLFQLHEQRDRIDELKEYFEAIPGNIEVTRFAQILCDLNSYLNDTEISIFDIDVFNFNSEGNSKGIFENLQKNMANIHEADASTEPTDKTNWNTYSIKESHEFEKNLLFAISHGQVEKLSEAKFFNQSVSVGKLASDNMRQLKNSLICSAVLASRAAIDGGLNIEQAYTLCNIYIQKIENSRNFSELSNLSKQIIIDYAKRVSALKVGETHSPVVARAIQYIAHNINQRLYIEEIAQKLNSNRSYLSVKFKNETGMTLTDYIIQQKIFEAQRLIRYTDRSLLQISSYLDFSSQSYFQMQFKKYTGMTPAQYKKNNKE